MWVSATLYKSGFTPRDVFVGTSSAARFTALDAWDVPKKTVAGSYNPDDPFRLSGNFLEFDRKYDYCVYTYMTAQNGSIIERRGYFVQSFEYINDNLTRMRVLPDLVADVFYKVKFSKILPGRYTYIDSIKNSYPYGIRERDEVFNFQSSKNLLVKNSRTNSSKYTNLCAGIIIVSITCANYLEGSALFPISPTKRVFLRQTVIDGIAYPVTTFLLPFIWDSETGKIFDEYDGHWTLDGFTPSADEICTLKDFTDLCQMTEISYEFPTGVTAKQSGITFISSSICLDPAEYVGVFSVNEAADGSAQVQFIFKNYSDLQIDFSSLSATPHNIKRIPTLISMNTESESVMIDFPASNSFIYPLYNVKCVMGNNDINIDPFSVRGKSARMLNLPIPPYSSIVFFPHTNDGDIIVANFTNNSEFMNYDTAYNEFLRNNKNSTIVGMSVNHAAQWIQTGVQSAAQIGTAVATGNPLGAVSAVLNPIGTAINQAREREMLQLKLKDIRNGKTSISLQTMIQEAISSHNYIQVLSGENYAFDELFYQILSEGVYLPYFFQNSAFPKSHTSFDFLQSDEIEIDGSNNAGLSLADISILKGYISAGVRYWYSLSTFKKIIPNAEVTT